MAMRTLLMMRGRAFLNPNQASSCGKHAAARGLAFAYLFCQQMRQT
ncbi:MAG: hypothetical protein IH586_09965 [Anaerolineaceae bacterium]|nr:hypothetical protein [Anaerolineaceae bacterium]